MNTSAASPSGLSQGAGPVRLHSQAPLMRVLQLYAGLQPCPHLTCPLCYPHPVTQGNTVSCMGPYKGLKQIRRIVEDCIKVGVKRCLTRGLKEVEV